MRASKLLFTTLVAFITVYSYVFVDANFPLGNYGLVAHMVSIPSFVKLIFYVLILIGMYIWYAYMLRRPYTKNTVRRLRYLLAGMVIVLLFSYPAFSYDIFNYVATAKVLFLYGENPYVVMPVEFPNDPLLDFMHAANKTALYGPSWILLTGVPFFAGFGNLYLTLFMFKLFVALFYLGTCYLIWKLSKHRVFSLIFFALNPLVIIETLVSGHNDSVMVFFALASFYLLQKRFFIFSVSSLLLSIFIKYATVVLVPIYIYTLVKTAKKGKIFWDDIWFYSFFALLAAVVLSPVREELYSWYFIWPMAFLSLVHGRVLLKVLAVAFSFGLLLRFAPFVYFRTWEGVTPVIKEIVTWSSVVIGGAAYAVFVKKFHAKIR